MKKKNGIWMSALFIITGLILILANTCKKETCAPTLISPEKGALLDNGCYPDLDPIIWSFEWTSCSGATNYNLYVIGASASIPVIDIETAGLTYRDSTFGDYIGGPNLLGWKWKVRAFSGGNWGEWSEIRTFDVELINTDCKK